MIECSYGLQKRLDFLSNLIASTRPRRVLDVGCGTGANLTELLAQQFPLTNFIGIDSDAKSIAFAKHQSHADNVQYFVETSGLELDLFDLVIASEVIEHVENPPAFLEFLRGRLASNGHVVLTMPNGFGPYELASLLETLLYLSGLHWILRSIKRVVIKNSALPPDTVDTLAISPHINFFTYSSVLNLIQGSGFHIIRFRARTFLCGFGFDYLIRVMKLINWNASVSDKIPVQFSSAWMFILTPVKTPTIFIYKRGKVARFRRYLNETRWKR